VARSGVYVVHKLYFYCRLLTENKFTFVETKMYSYCKTVIIYNIQQHGALWMTKLVPKLEIDKLPLTAFWLYPIANSGSGGGGGGGAGYLLRPD
jgi:hypothetical protein